MPLARIPGGIKRGMGMAQSLWGANVQTASFVEVRILRDGSVEARSSVQDIGSGIGVVIAQTIAETLGLTPEQIKVLIGDTLYPPGPPSYGSRTTASITPPARVAAWKLLQLLFAEAALALNAAPSDLIARGGRIETRTEPKRGMSFAEAAALTVKGDMLSATETVARITAGSDGRRARRRRRSRQLGGVQFAEVVVETERHCTRRKGRRRAGLRQADESLLLESKIQGGVPMGLSYALYENRVDKSSRADGERQPRSLQGRRPARGSRRSTSWCSKTFRAAARPTPTASRSPPTSPPRRRSATPSTTRSACGCGRCRLLQGRSTALGKLPQRS